MWSVSSSSRPIGYDLPSASFPDSCGILVIRILCSLFVSCSLHVHSPGPVKIGVRGTETGG